MREMADKGTAQAKASYDKMSAATAEMSSVLKDAGATAAQGFKDSNAKVLEFARANSNAAFDYANQLLAVKSPSEFIELSSEQARKQFDVLSAQSKELTALSQKVMLETAEPLKAGAAKAFGRCSQLSAALTPALKSLQSPGRWPGFFLGADGRRRLLPPQGLIAGNFCVTHAACRDRRSSRTWCRAKSRPTRSSPRRFCAKASTPC